MTREEAIKYAQEHPAWFRKANGECGEQLGWRWTKGFHFATCLACGYDVLGMYPHYPDGTITEEIQDNPAVREWNSRTIASRRAAPAGMNKFADAARRGTGYKDETATDTTGREG